MHRALRLSLVLALAASPLGVRAQTDPATGGDLTCKVSGTSVLLTWPVIYWFAPIEGYMISRDDEKCLPGEKCAVVLDPGATKYADQDVPPGNHVYVLSAINFTGGLILIGRCEVTVPAADGLTCTVKGRVVHLTWPGPQITTPLDFYQVYRDGQVIARVTAPAYNDAVPAVGEYAYKVEASLGLGPPILIGECRIQIDCFDLETGVGGLKVTLKWQYPPIMIPIGIDAKFIVSRDGQTIAETKETSYADTVPAPGTYLYEVWFDPGIGGIRNFFIGACRVAVSGEILSPPHDLRCFVASAVDTTDPSIQPPVVFMNWANPVEYDSIIVWKDGQEHARLEGTAKLFMESLVAPGPHVYGVQGEKDGLRSETVQCRVQVPGDLLVEPLDVRCEILPVVILIFPPPPPSVRITWTNGDDYETIVIVEGSQVLATLPGGPAGEKREFVIEGVSPGPHRYCVFGAAGNARSLPSCCQVDVPGTAPPAPQDLTCTVVRDIQPEPIDPATGAESSVLPPFPFAHVLLKWMDPVTYDKILVLRNGMLIASLPGTATLYRDHVAGGGTIEYTLIGIVGDEKSEPARCKVDVGGGEVPPPQDFTCALIDIYLDSTDPDAGGKVEPGEVLPVNAVVLKWWNPVRYAKLILYRDRGILAELPGDAMRYRDISPPAGEHVYAIRGIVEDGGTSDYVTCTIFIGATVPPVEELLCAVEEKANPDTVDLMWKNGAVYDAVLIARNGQEIATLPGGETRYKDAGLSPGVYAYAVAGVQGNVQSRPSICQAVIEGPPARNLLYFSGAFRDPATGSIPSFLTNRIICLATNGSPVQAWSFGVQSDPKFIVPSKYDLKETVTAGFHGGVGPDFIVVDLLDGGVTMAVLIETEIDTAALAEVLPPGTGQPLLNIEYAAGPSGSNVEIYQVEYSGALGDPPVQVLFVVDGFEVRPATLPGWVSLPGKKFLRGDLDGSGKPDITDAIKLLAWMFLKGAVPGCLEAADMNDSGNVNIADPVYILYFIYLSGQDPPWPFPDCGEAPAQLGCSAPEGCE